MSKPTERLQWEASGNEIVLKGLIDEHAPTVLAEAKTAIGNQVVFDLAGVRRINSLGVRAWIQFIRSLVGREVAFRRCTPPFVEQLNALVDFRGHARVESVLAPYLCESCGDVRFEDIGIGRDLQAGSQVLEAPPRTCSRCHAPMQFDDLPDRYFQFVTYEGKRAG